MKPWARGVLALWGLAMLVLLAGLAWFGFQAASQLGSHGYSGLVMQQCAPPDLPLPSGISVKSVNVSVNSPVPAFWATAVACLLRVVSAVVLRRPAATIPR
jgi:uncharacterized membrane protein